MSYTQYTYFTRLRAHGMLTYVRGFRQQLANVIKRPNAQNAKVLHRPVRDTIGRSGPNTTCARHVRRVKTANKRIALPGIERLHNQ